MARYIKLFNVPSHPPNLKQTIAGIVESCDLDVVYEAKDYLVAQEKPDEVSYKQLARVEFLINSPVKEQAQTQIDLVVKNEELPLKINNHCQQVFDLVSQRISETVGWQAA